MNRENIRKERELAPVWAVTAHIDDKETYRKRIRRFKPPFGQTQQKFTPDECLKFGIKSGFRVSWIIADNQGKGFTLEEAKHRLALQAAEVGGRRFTEDSFRTFSEEYSCNWFTKPGFYVGTELIYATGDRAFTYDGVSYGIVRMRRE